MVPAATVCTGEDLMETAVLSPSCPVMVAVPKMKFLPQDQREPSDFIQEVVV